MSTQLEQFVETLTLVFDNPVSINTPSGEILALTERLEGWTPDADWHWRMENRRIPMEALNAPQLDQMGVEHADWSDKATLYENEGHRYVGVYIMLDGAPAACLAVTEAKHELGSRDVALIQHFADMFSQDPLFAQSVGHAGSVQQDLSRLLEGGDPLYAASLPSAPWRLITLRNIAREDSMYREQLTKSLAREGLPLACAQHEGFVIALVESAGTDAFLDAAKRLGLENHYQIATSATLRTAPEVPRGFSQCKLIHAHMEHGKAAMATFDACAPELIVTAVNQKVPEMGALRHAALDQLRAYDEANGTELFTTLRVYLAEERSVKRTAERLFIHRNTLAYRIERIGAMCDINLDDDKTRQHLALSFLLL